MQDAHDILRLILEVALALAGFFGVFVLHGIRQSIDSTKRSVDELNVKVATIIEKTSNHERELGRLDSRVGKLETKV